MAKTAKQPKVVMYSASWCVWCNRTKEFFKEHGIKYTDYDVDKDEKAKQELIKKSGQMGIPVIDIDGQIVVGFDEGRLRQLLHIK